MDEKDRKSATGDKNTVGEADKSSQQPESVPSPMFGRSAGGQYGGTQPDSFNNYGAHNDKKYHRPEGTFGNTRPGSPYFDIELYASRKSVTRLGDAIGLPLCMFFIISFALSFIIEFLLSVKDFGAARQLLSDPNINYIVDSCISLVVLTVPYLYTLKATGSTFGELVPVKKVSPSKVSALVMLSLGVSVLSNYAGNLLAYYSEILFGVEFKSAAPAYGDGAWSFVIMLLCVGILPAVLEEFAVRGIILGALRKRFSDTASIVISAILFGLLHGNLQQIPFAFCMGLLLGYATVYSGSIVPAVIIHAINNCISVVISFAMTDLSPMVRSVSMLLYFAVALVIGICGFIMLIKTDNNALCLSKERSENTMRDFTWFFSSAWIVAFVIMCVLQVLAVQRVFG